MAETDRRILWAPEAERDLLTIWEWGAARFSPEVADLHLRAIEKSVSALARAPFLGRARDDLLPGVRSIVVHPTVVFYRVGRGTLDIVRVVDGRRNLAALFERSDR